MVAQFESKRKGCKGCDTPLSATAALFGGPSGLCHDCKDKSQVSHYKNRMTKDSRKKF